MDEFEFIDKIRLKYGLKSAGDDCAVLPKNKEFDQVITADMLVEDIDFRLNWTTPEFLGHKALAVSLSDIAAMGAEARWSLLTIAAPEEIWNSDFLDRFYEGWMVLARKYGIELVGGDVSRSPDKLVIDSIVGGEVPHGKALLRSGARPGDGVFVTGTLGGAAGGLKLLDNGVIYSPEVDEMTRRLLLRQLKPMPQLESAKSLMSLNIITAMIDISDGLSSDVAHICRESGVGAEIAPASLPVDPDIGAHFTSGEAFQMALNGGEDFELLFTAPPDLISLPGVTRIGTITGKAGVVEFIDGEPLQPRGYRHF